jgi:acyl carrier protein
LLNLAAMRDEVLKKLRQILVDDFQRPAEAVHEDAHMRVDLKLDSLSIVDLFFLIQKDFGFKATTEDFKNCRTVGSIVDVITAKLGTTSP